jgi:hypothetical protein
MSHCFRPVRHEYGTPSACFVNVYGVAGALENIAEQAGTSATTDLSGDDDIGVDIGDGTLFLDACKNRSYDAQAAKDAAIGYIKGYLPEDYTEGVDEDVLDSLFSNLAAYADEWREYINRNGGITFSIG